MRPIFFAAAVISLISTAARAQESWTSPVDIASGRRGVAVMVVDTVDATDRELSGRFADEGGALAARVSSGTIFRGFADEVARGSVVGFAGLGDVRTGDRVRIRGTGVSTGVMQAEEIVLVGRAVAGGATQTTARPATLEGIVRSVSRTENRFTMETSGRDIVTILGEAATPVLYEGRTYGIGNLEAGDGVRVTVGAWEGSSAIARAVDVVSDARDARAGSLTSVSGRITATNSSARRATLETVRGDLVDLDLADATDELGRPIRAADLTIGDELDVSGRSLADGAFRVSVMRRVGGSDAGAMRTFDVSGAVAGPLGDGGLLRLDAARGTRSQVLVHPDQPVRFRPGRWFRASELQTGDRIRVRGLTGPNGEMVAQVIEIESMAAEN